MNHSIDANQRRGLKLPRRTVLVRVLLALSVLGALAMASTASATPVEGPEGEGFYTAPKTLPTTKNGELIQYRPTTLNLNVTLPGYKAWKVMYQSETQKEKPIAVTGTVIDRRLRGPEKVPGRSSRSGSGRRASASSARPPSRWKRAPSTTARR